MMMMMMMMMMNVASGKLESTETLWSCNAVDTSCNFRCREREQINHHHLSEGSMMSTWSILKIGLKDSFNICEFLASFVLEVHPFSYVPIVFSIVISNDFPMPKWLQADRTTPLGSGTWALPPQRSSKPWRAFLTSASVAAWGMNY